MKISKFFLPRLTISLRFKTSPYRYYFCKQINRQYFIGTFHQYPYSFFHENDIVLLFEFYEQLANSSPMYIATGQVSLSYCSCIELLCNSHFDELQNNSNVPIPVKTNTPWFSCVGSILTVLKVSSFKVSKVSVNKN